jgi:hypothetical protein
MSESPNPQPDQTAVSLQGPADLDERRHLEAFRRYIEAEGVVEFLTQVLVAEIEEPSAPSTALATLKNRVAQVNLKELEDENRRLKETLNQLVRNATTRFSSIDRPHFDYTES